jgi:DNA-binding transcriptional MocR family regulator
MEVPRAQTVDYPRKKIYLSNLNQLIDRKISQPEVEVASKLFPQRDFARKLSVSHQRTQSSIQFKAQRFDLKWTPKKNSALIVESKRSSPKAKANPFRLA